jgi:serpin B
MKYTSRALPLLLLAAMLGGCTPPPTVGPDGGPGEKPANADKAPEDDVKALARGSNEFSFDLLRAVDEKGNVFLSPFSVGTALSLTFANNDGDALSKSLHVPFKQERLNFAYSGLLGRMHADDESLPYELRLANAVWLTNSKEFKPFPEYVKAAKDNYAAPPHSVDFTGDGVDQINKWCAEQTKDKVPTILMADDVDDKTAAVLTNAIYFKGAWRFKFKEADTKPADFHVKPGRTIKAQTMAQLAKLRHAHAEGAQVLEMPYKGDHLTMLVVLPNEKDGLAKVEKGLTAEQLEKWSKALKERKVRVFLPRFKIAGGRIQLKKTLKGMGLPMTEEPKIGTPPPGMFLYIDEVFHRTYVEVNEEGAEAAAVTAVVVKWKDKGGGKGDDTLPFRADHPFLFLIRDNRTGCILFIGRVVDPS